MVIDVRDLKRQVGRAKTLNINIDLSEPEAAVTGTATITNVGPAIVADFDIRADIHTECSRCLKPMLQPIQARFTREYRQGEPGDEQIDVSWYTGDDIDITPDIQEQITLSLDMKPMCRTDCRGLCPSCGADRNETDCQCEQENGDPRLQALRQLLDR